LANIALTIPKILWMFFVFIIFSSSLIDFAFAQNDVTIQNESPKTIDDLDDLLTTSVTATLTGLSIAGATFLGRSFSDKEEETKRHTIQAQKNFIKAFSMFLICTISIFVFDFFEIVRGNPSIYVLISDLIITYGFFGVGVMYLIKSAKDLYIMYER